MQNITEEVKKIKKDNLQIKVLDGFKKVNL